MTDRETVQRDQKSRWTFLYELYKHHRTLPRGNIQVVPASEIAKGIGITDEAEADRILSYLNDAGLVKILTFGGGIGITKTGIDAVEEAIAEPDKKTEHFSPINLIYIAGDVLGSQVQQGGTENVQTINQASKSLQSLRELLPHLRAALESIAPSDPQVKADMDTVEAQLRSTTPRTGVIRECLASLQQVLEQASGSAIAARVLALMQQGGWV